LTCFAQLKAELRRATEKREILKKAAYFGVAETGPLAVELVRQATRANDDHP
jgi:hypothetical protein